ncbi:MAG: hypothetical protein AAB443_03240 [Patescibacteria group bacterium]
MDDLVQAERLSRKLTIGCEIEIPYTGRSPAYGSIKDLKPASYIHFAESSRILNILDVPYETDKQGEAAIPKTRNIKLQLAIIQELHQMGFLPLDFDKQHQLNFTLHVNIGIPKELIDFLQSTNYEGTKRNTPYESREKTSDFVKQEVLLLSTLFGIAYTTPNRITKGAYTIPAEVKGHGEDLRIEFRNQTYVPENDNEALLENMRLTTLGFMLALSQNGNDEVKEAYQAFLNTTFDDIEKELGGRTLKGVQLGFSNHAGKACENETVKSKVALNIATFAKIVENSTKGTYS